ncbi:MAG TPA: hypothetical protein VIY27_02065 [Myxococcota bacterium]
MNIHPTAVLHPEAKLHPTVKVGAFCVIGQATIGRDVIIDHHCVIDRAELGALTRVRSFVELRDGTVVGTGCYIDSGVKSSGKNCIGDRVVVRFDAILARGCEVGDESFIAPQVMTINLDHQGTQIGGAKIGKRCHVGTAAVLHPGIELCDDVVIGAQALVTRDCTEPGIYVGIPAKLSRHLGQGI